MGSRSLINQKPYQEAKEALMGSTLTRFTLVAELSFVTELAQVVWPSQALGWIRAQFDFERIPAQNVVPGEGTNVASAVADSAWRGCRLSRSVMR